MENRDPFLKIIESEKLIGDRFRNPTRIDPNGGNGHFSLLLKVYDIKTGKHVALKFYDPAKFSLTDRVIRFRREAEMLSLLESEPYVINLIEGLSEFPCPIIHQQTGIKVPLMMIYFAIDWADSNIEQIIYSEKLSALDSLLLFKEMMKAVFRVHKRNICHRDLKPDNFLLSSDQVCVSDFGTAKCMDGTMPDISISYENPVGHSFYVAPELKFSLGIADEYVFRSDIFSMGAILFEMFTRTVLTSEIYTKSVIEKLLNVKAVMSVMSEKDRIETYQGIINDLVSKIPLPDIFAYNEYVPNCIKLHLNNLYKSLSSINFFRRQINPPAIHRSLDIFIIILSNEEKYTKWRNQTRQRLEAKQCKKQILLEKN